MGLIIGSFCDQFIPRLSQAALLGVFSLLLNLVGTARNYSSWTVARVFISFIGATFVVTKFWTSFMLSGSVVGTTNATSAVWDNLGGGFAQIFITELRAAVAFSRGIDPNYETNDTACHIAVIILACALVMTAAALHFLAEYLPDGNDTNLIKSGKKKHVDGGKTKLVPSPTGACGSCSCCTMCASVSIST